MNTIKLCDPLRPLRLCDVKPIGFSPARKFNAEMQRTQRSAESYNYLISAILCVLCASAFKV